jgi:hypothetical protein
MIIPANVNLSTTSAHNRGSVNVFVHEENGSLEALGELVVALVDDLLV